MNEKITAVVLAAGRGTRMKSSRAKVLHSLFFKPMIHHVLDSLEGTGIDRTVVVVGHQRQEVMAALEGRACIPAIQDEQLGTGHAVLCARESCAGSDLVLILCGDTPLLDSHTLTAMIRAHCDTDAVLTVMTTVVDDPFGYGRIISDNQGEILAIREEKDASDDERRIREINGGIYLVRTDFLFPALEQVGTENSQGEVYLTDIVAIANGQGLSVRRFLHHRPLDVLGVNSRVELARAHAELQRRHNRKLMESGVTLYAPETILIAPDCTIGPDTVIEAGTRISGGSRIGRDAHLATGAVLHHCRVGDGAAIGAHCVLTSCTVEPGEQVPPLTHRVG